MVRDEFQCERFRRRPGQRLAGRGGRPAFEIGQIRRQRPQAVLAHALAREVLERRDVVVGEELRQPVPTVHGQDRRERIEVQGAPGFGVEGSAFDDVIHDAPQNP